MQRTLPVPAPKDPSTMCVTNSVDPRLQITLPISNEEVATLVDRVQQTVRRTSATNAKMTKKPVHRVVHCYHDHLGDSVESTIPEPVARGGVMTPFPVKLHEVLSNIEKDGLDDVISWQPHGRCFVVHKAKEFVDHVMPHYFNQTKIASFQRQLNLYGFQRLTKGPDKNGYYHELFLKGKVWLAQRISRQKVKGTRVRAKSSPNTEPNFYAMPPVADESVGTNDELMPEQQLQIVPDDAFTPTATNAATVSPHLTPSISPETVMGMTLAPLEAAPQLPSMGQIPDEVPHQDDDDNDVLFFEGCKFHYLDPFASRHEQHTVPFHPAEVHSTHEHYAMDQLFESLQLPRPEAPVSLEDDMQFTELVEALLM